MPLALERVRSIGPFDGWLRGAIIQFKYHGEWARGEQLAAPLAALLSHDEPYDALVPVPLHPARLKHRGFNQATVVAEHAGRRLGIEVSESLIRSKRTAPQVTLGADARGMNVADAFRLRSGAPVHDRRLLLVDDVITTGSTLAACAAVLLDAGARLVGVATIAREL